MSLDVTLVCDGDELAGGAAPGHIAWVRDGATTPRQARRLAAELHDWTRLRGHDLCGRCASRYLPRSR